ncbi:MAG: hypothetical protein NXI32_29675, partial [bacterium]|nr:hypothetical protein [bacterium]
PGALKKRDDLYAPAVDIVVREGRGSCSLLQRALGIGYGRAARLIDYMAEDGIVGQYNGSQAREVLLSIADWEAMQAGEDSGDAPSPVAAAPVAPAAPSAPAAPAVPAAVVQPPPQRQNPAPEHPPNSLAAPARSRPSHKIRPHDDDEQLFADQDEEELRNPPQLAIRRGRNVVRPLPDDALPWEDDQEPGSDPSTSDHSASSPAKSSNAFRQDDALATPRSTASLRVPVIGRIDAEDEEFEQDDDEELEQQEVEYEDEEEEEYEDEEQESDEDPDDSDSDSDDSDYSDAEYDEEVEYEDAEDEDAEDEEYDEEQYEDEEYDEEEDEDES